MEDRYQLNKELAQMLKGGVIMDVTTPEQAVIDRLSLRRKQVHVQSWHLNGYRLTSEPLAEYQE